MTNEKVLAVQKFLAALAVQLSGNFFSGPFMCGQIWGQTLILDAHMSFHSSFVPT